jgi:hypothetical protein
MGTILFLIYLLSTKSFSLGLGDLGHALHFEFVDGDFSCFLFLLFLALLTSLSSAFFALLEDFLDIDNVAESESDLLAEVISLFQPLFNGLFL